MKLKFDKLKQKKNIKGNVVKYINPKNKYLKVIKEVYLSELKPKTTKAWKINFTCDQYLTNLDGEFIFYYKKNLNEKKKQKKMNVYDAVFIPKKVLDTSQPNITFDENGISNHYWEFEKMKKKFPN